VVPPEASSQSQTSEPSVGEKWAEFPPVERQAELKRILKQNQGTPLAPFAKFKLTGADVYWLAAHKFGEETCLPEENLLTATVSLGTAFSPYRAPT